MLLPDDQGAGFGEIYTETAEENRFVDQQFFTDFTNAKITVRAKGELALRGAQIALLVQGTCDGLTSEWALTPSPLTVGVDSGINVKSVPG